MSTHANTKEKYTYKRIEIKQLLASKYPFITVQSLGLIKKGIINTSIRIVTQDGVSYLLRIYRSAGRTKKDIAQELEFCKQLQKSGLPVAVVMPNTSDKQITILKTSAGTYAAALFSFLPGGHIKSSQHHLIPSVAHAHAKMHIIALNSKTKRSTSITIAPIMHWLEVEYMTAQKKIKNNRELQQKCAQLYNELISFYKKYAKDIKVMPAGLCHLDYDSDNILETKGKVTGIVDFDDMQNTPFSLDLAFSLWWWCFYNRKKRDFVFSTYLKQYESRRRLTKQEKSMILFFLRIRNFILLNLLFINLPSAVDVFSAKKALRFDAWIISKSA